MAKKGKGLTPEELQIFNENEAYWQGDYFRYIKSVTTQREVELAQLRRRFQSSFHTVGSDHYAFRLVFSQPGELSRLPAELVLEVLAPEPFPDLCVIRVANADVPNNIKEGLQRALADSIKSLRSLWRTVRAIDNHAEEMLEEAMKPRVEVSEDPEEEAKEVRQVPQRTEAETEQRREETVPPSEPARVRASRAPVLTFTASTQFILLRSVGAATCSSLSLAVNCSRCRQLVEVTLVIDTAAELFSGQGDCENCHQALFVDFKPAVLHEHNLSNLGEVKSQGCVPLRVLYLTYRLTCTGCGADTESSALGILEKYSGNCRECQGKIAFSVGQVEFHSDAQDSTDRQHRQKKPRPQVVVGQPLPENGACKHYKQSYRWFRFRCCQNAFPCDKCHEEQSEPHEFDRADFMLCGFCSTEQKIGNIVTCVRCKAAVTAGAVGEKRFWEGGKGCRSQVLMSKNDRRKHRK